MATLVLNGPDKEVFNKAEVVAYLRLGSTKTLDRLIAAGTFPRGIKLTPQAEPIWTALDLACFLHLAARMQPADSKEPETDE